MTSTTNEPSPVSHGSKEPEDASNNGSPFDVAGLKDIINAHELISALRTNTEEDSNQEKADISKVKAQELIKSQQMNKEHDNEEVVKPSPRTISRGFFSEAAMRAAKEKMEREKQADMQRASQKKEKKLPQTQKPKQMGHTIKVHLPTKKEHPGMHRDAIPLDPDEEEDDNEQEVQEEEISIDSSVDSSNNQHQDVSHSDTHQSNSKAKTRKSRRLKEGSSQNHHHHGTSKQNSPPHQKHYHGRQRRTKLDGSSRNSDGIEEQGHHHRDHQRRGRNKMDASSSHEEETTGKKQHHREHNRRRSGKMDSSSSGANKLGNHAHDASGNVEGDSSEEHHARLSSPPQRSSHHSHSRSQRGGRAAIPQHPRRESEQSRRLGRRSLAVHGYNKAPSVRVRRHNSHDGTLLKSPQATVGANDAHRRRMVRRVLSADGTGHKQQRTLRTSGHSAGTTDVHNKKPPTAQQKKMSRRSTTDIGLRQLQRGLFLQDECVQHEEEELRKEEEERKHLEHMAEEMEKLNEQVEEELKRQQEHKAVSPSSEKDTFGFGWGFQTDENTNLFAATNQMAQAVGATASSAAHALTGVLGFPSVHQHLMPAEDNQSKEDLPQRSSSAPEATWSPNWTTFPSSA